MLVIRKAATHGEKQLQLTTRVLQNVLQNQTTMYCKDENDEKISN